MATDQAPIIYTLVSRMSLNARVFVFASEGYSDGYAFCTSSFPGPQKGIVAYADLKYAGIPSGARHAKPNTQLVSNLDLPVSSSFPQ